MNLFKFIWSASEKEAITIVILSVINGISGGLLLVLFPNAALNIYSKDQYLYYAIVLVITITIFLVSRHLCHQKTEALAGMAVEDMVLTVANTVRHAELSEFEQYSRSDIFLCIADAPVISNALAQEMESFQAYIVLFIGWLYIFAFISPLVGIFLLAARLFKLLIQEMFRKIIISFVDEQSEEEKEMFTAFRNHLDGFKELKFSQSKCEDIFENYLMIRIEGNKIKRIKSRRYLTELFLTNMLIHLLTMVFCTSIPMSLAPEDIIRIIIILLFTLQNDMLINASLHNIAEGNAALERFRHLFDPEILKKSDEDVPSFSQKPIQNFRAITIDDVQFSYPASLDSQGFLVNIKHLTIKSGEILFIVGGNGSGKSTLINILTGLYLPDKGVIKIDDCPVLMKEHRNIFSAVFSNFHLFDRFYGSDAVDEKRVYELLKFMKLEGKTRYTQDGFTTLDLSTGQRKRLALVIAMMEDRPVFVFDEWAADQDPHFRHYFYEHILPSLKAKGKTIIAITHDDRYFHISDQVIRMEYGQIIEQWRPDLEKQFQPLTSSLCSAQEKTRPSEENIFQNSQKTGEREKEQDTEYSNKGMLNQLMQIFQEERNVVKKILGLLLFFAFSMTGLTIIIIRMPQQEQIPTQWYILMPLFLILMVISFRQLYSSFSQALEKRIAALRVHVSDHVRKTDLLTLNHIGAGKIYTFLTSDIRTVAETSDIILVCFQGGIRMIMIYVFIGFLFPPACMIMILLTGIGSILYSLNHIKLIKLFEQLRDQERNQFEAVNHLLDGFRELKLCHRKSNDFFHKSFKHHASILRKLKRQFVRYYTNNATITYGFWNGMLLILILILPWIGLPIDIIPIAVALVLTMPLRQIVDRYSQFHMAYLSIQRLFQFEKMMKHLGEEPASVVRPDKPIKYESVRYKDISFTYRLKDSRPFSIGPLNISFIPGEIVFITGGNGSGKTTLLNVITGLYPIDFGRVFLNNKKETDIRMHRELFGPIFSDFYLFDRLYGMKDIDESKLNDLLKRFRLEERIQCSSHGKFSTLDLSTGQRKRLAMLVTIMEDKPIYVFDEWAADQDPHFREYFYKTLLPEFKAQGKTVIAVTHDDRYFHVADRILHLEYGQLSSTSSKACL
jgi:putative ATP-binding cassette transporter